MPKFAKKKWKVANASKKQLKVAEDSKKWP